jgi:hypothetical protein
LRGLGRNWGVIFRWIIETHGFQMWTGFIWLRIFFLISIVGGGVQLGPLSTAATNRPIVPAPGDYDDGEIGGMMISRENRSTWRKPTSMPLCPPQIPHAARTRTRAAAVGSQGLTAWTTARPWLRINVQVSKQREVYWLAEQLLASRGRLCCMDLLVYNIYRVQHYVSTKHNLH